MIDVLGPEKRRRRTTQEKIAIVQQSFEPGMTVSLVARQHGVAASQLFLWRKQYQEGSLTAVAAGEQVVPASELAAAMKQIKELQRLLGKKTMENERVYRIMRQNALLLERKPAVPPSKRAHTGRVAVKESNQRWCSDGFEFCCDNGERLRVTFALDCCDREALHWAVTTGGFNSETVQDVMLGAVERRFGNDLPSSPVEWLTDNGSCYRANETRQFARMLGLEPKNTAVRSPESNGIAESFVKTIKRDYISIMPKPDGLTAAKNLAEAFEHYNEWHPHSALGYRSPRGYLRQRACNGLSDNRCLEI
ncbi:IS3 family transposase [Shigella dysenteriae]|nr:IS3 family transposase [Shigella dysenteriae]